MSNDAAKAVLEWAFAGFLIALMVCGKHFQFPGITSVCPRCVNAGIKHISAGMSGA